MVALWEGRVGVLLTLAFASTAVLIGAVVLMILVTPVAVIGVVIAAYVGISAVRHLNAYRAEQVEVVAPQMPLGLKVKQAATTLRRGYDVVVEIDVLLTNKSRENALGLTFALIYGYRTNGDPASWTITEPISHPHALPSPLNLRPEQVVSGTLIFVFPEHPRLELIALPDHPLGDLRFKLEVVDQISGARFELDHVQRPEYP